MAPERGGSAMVEDRKSRGKDLRSVAPRSGLANWLVPAGRPDPLDLLAAQDVNRLPDLVPVRMGRMAQSPFSYLRGAAVVMAHDLAGLVTTGIDVQVCGDAHVANFGLFASPERALLFDVDDFDETCVAPWELDVLRLSASAALAGRQAGHRADAQRRAAAGAARSYRVHMGVYASMGTLELWYSRVDAHQAESMLPDPSARTQLEAARRNTSQHVLPSLTALAPGGTRRIVDHPPLVMHQGVDEHGQLLQAIVAAYRASLVDDRRTLLDRFEVVDFARKAVGVGSIGTRCFVALLNGEGGDPLLLQVKEAQRPALSEVRKRAARRKGAAGGEGRRVVDGQRLMQAASDIFLGWASAQGVDFYVRQLRDMKGSVDATTLTPTTLTAYAELCGWTLARAHARSVGATISGAISGYLGSGSVFDDAVAGFATAYADQTERDHAQLVKAIKSGKVRAEQSG